MLGTSTGQDGKAVAGRRWTGSRRDLRKARVKAIVSTCAGLESCRRAERRGTAEDPCPMSRSRSLTSIDVSEYDRIEAAMSESERGRWFLGEYRIRNRAHDTASCSTRSDASNRR